MTKEDAFETLASEIGIGVIVGVGFLVFLVIAIALGGRKPPDT